jgi:predicted PurR-regulated permease PerM
MIDRDTPERRRRRWVVYSVTAALILLVGGWLFMSLRELLLPCVVGALLAYVSLPAIRRMRRAGVPKPAAILALFGTVILAFVLLGVTVTSALPDEIGALELRTRMRFKLNQRYEQVMGLDGDQKGNVLHKVFGASSAPMYRKVNDALRLTPEEVTLLEVHHVSGDEQLVRQVSERVWGYHQANVSRDASLFVQQKTGPRSKEDAKDDEASATNQLFATALSIMSLWMATPFVFLFLLLDDGRIKRWIIDLVPNRYFELTLTTIDRVDKAIGSYLRGTFLECSLVGLTFVVCLSAIGFPFTWALLIGAVAGVANAIPFLGPVIGLIAGVAYALIAEDISPILPFFNEENLVVGVLLTVGVAQGLDNAVFQPIVLGSAVNLHPLVVILGVMGGSMLFGFFGMLFAIPAIVIVKVVVSTTLTQLQAYRLI